MNDWMIVNIWMIINNWMAQYSRVNYDHSFMELKGDAMLRSQGCYGNSFGMIYCSHTTI